MVVRTADIYADLYADFVFTLCLLFFFGIGGTFQEMESTSR